MNNTARKLQDVLKLLEECTYKVDTNKLLRDIFELGAIAISNKFDYKKKEKREERYAVIIQEYKPDMQQLISEIFCEIYNILSRQTEPNVGFEDYLGELYMLSNTSNKSAGQFFTPYAVAKISAAAAVNEEKVKKCIESDTVYTMYEPTCGSGGMLIAAADILYRKCKLNISRNLFIECSDIDSRCVHMAYLQLGLAGIPAVIYRQDALTLETYERWETPAYLMQWLRFRNLNKLRG